MDYLAAFMGGSVFTLLLTAGCFLLAFKASEYKEDSEMKRERKRSLLVKGESKGGVIKPKSPERKARESDDTEQAIQDVISRF